MQHTPQYKHCPLFAGLCLFGPLLKTELFKKTKKNKTELFKKSCAIFAADQYETSQSGKLLYSNRS